MIKNILTLSILFSLTFLVFPSPAYAYLDPGSGSFIFQVIIASLVGSGFLIKNKWSKFKNLFGKKERKNSDGDKK